MPNTNSDDRSGLFYVESIGGRWSTQPVSYFSLARARAHYEADVASRDYMAVRLLDCSTSPIGTVLANVGGGA